MKLNFQQKAILLTVIVVICSVCAGIAVGIELTSDHQPYLENKAELMRELEEKREHLDYVNWQIEETGTPQELIDRFGENAIHSSRYAWAKYWETERWITEWEIWILEWELEHGVIL